MLAWLLGPLPDERSGYAARQKCGERAGFVGIGTNLLLFAIKLTIGILSGAVSVIADALNNLSDAGTSLAMIFGFRIAGRPADAEHPFGHGRAEYLAGLLIAVVILLVGVELLHTSVEKLITPEAMKVSVVGMAVLVSSLLLKFWLAWFYRAVGRHIQSPALLAASVDSLSDCVATSAVVASLGAYHFFDVNIDGAAGILVACFILYSGWGALKDAAQPLMGMANDPALAADIRGLVFRESNVLGLHDLIIHGYGAGRTYATLHIELPATMTLHDAHHIADRIERSIRGELQISVTVHVDPVETNDPEADRLFVLSSRILSSIDARLALHDFHVSPYREGRKIRFEVACPEDLPISDRELRRSFLRQFLSMSPKDRALLRIDHQFC